MKRATPRSHLRVVIVEEQAEGLLRVCESIDGTRWPERYENGAWQTCDWPEEPYLDLELAQ